MHIYVLHSVVLLHCVFHVVSYFLVILYNYFASIEMFLILYISLIFFCDFLNEVVFVLNLICILFKTILALQVAVLHIYQWRSKGGGVMGKTQYFWGGRPGQQI